MGYTDKMRWEDQSKILYSPYYAALADKQHGSGIMTEKEFLQRKTDIAKEMFAVIGGKDPLFLEILFTADSLAATPYGFGGRNVLREAYQYDKNDIARKIAREIQLSDILIGSLLPSETRTLEAILLDTLNAVLENIDVPKQEMKKELLECASAGKIARDKFLRFVEDPRPAEKAAKIAKQESDMRFVIGVLERDGVPGGGDPLMFLLGNKERNFAQRA